MKNIKRIFICIVILIGSITLSAQDRVISESFIITRPIISFRTDGIFYLTKDGVTCTIEYEQHKYVNNIAKVYLTYKGEIIWSRTFSSSSLIAIRSKYDGHYHYTLKDQNFLYFGLVYISAKEGEGYVVSLDAKEINQ